MNWHILPSCWEEGLDVVVEGEAVRITDHDRLEQFARVWATRWDGRWQYLVRDGSFYHYDEHEVLPDSILVFSVKFTKVFAFAKGHFSHTRHTRIWKFGRHNQDLGELAGSRGF